MIVAVHQPQFLPWLGYFHKILIADAFCLLDNVQFKKNEWQNRNRIKTIQGWQWLTVPVKYRFSEKINEVEINDAVNWRRKHLESLKYNYRKAPFYHDYVGVLENAYGMEWESISVLNCYLIENVRHALGIQNRPMARSSQMVGLSEDPTQRLVDICRAMGGDTYLSGADGPRYMDMETFRENGIDVMVQDFQHPVYPQQHGEFQSHLSIIDLLFNCGPRSAEIILGEQTT